MLPILPVAVAVFINEKPLFVGIKEDAVIFVKPPLLNPVGANVGVGLGVGVGVG